jgi:glycosyltransferase involved in cell wall biosynthesis
MVDIWTGPINSLGYGQAACGYFYGLNEFGHTYYNLIGEVNVKDAEITSGSLPVVTAYERYREYQKTIKGYLLGDIERSIGFWHLTHSDAIPKGEQRCIISTFEVDDFPPEVLAKLKEFDAIGTASTWGADVLRKHLPDTKIFVTPHAYKPYETWSDRGPGREHSSPIAYWNEALDIDMPSETQVVSTIGKFERRKGHYELLDSVLEIGKKRPILLLAAWFNPFMAQNFPFFVAHQKDLRPILTKPEFISWKKDMATVIFFPRTDTRKTLLRYMMQSDVYAAPSYCEGWNFPLFEMMTCGALCIASMNTAHLDYCTSSNVIPLSDQTVVPAIDETPFFSGRGTWNQISQRELQEAIEKAHTMSPTESERIRELAKSTCNQFNWTKSGDLIIKALEE